MIACLGSTASADVINVPDDYPTIQQAIDAAVNGDEIIVARGTYVEDIDFLSKDIIVRSTEPTDPDVVAATVIDGDNDPQNPGTVVTLSAGTITGFTITGGYGNSGKNPGGAAGGVFATDSSTVTYNVIADNFAPGSGGGIYARDNAIVANNSILANQCTDRGGGAWLLWNVVFTNNIVANNQAIEQFAGGVFAAGDVRITNCLIDGNQANTNDEGGGVWLSGDSVLEGCMISNNSASAGSGVLAYDRSIVRNNIITGNSGGGQAVRLRDGSNENFVLFTGNIVADNIGTGVRASGHAVVHTNVIKGNLGGVGSVGGATVTGSALFANNTVLSNSGSVIGGVFCNNGATVVNNIVAFAVSGGGILKPANFVGLEDYNCVFGNVGGDFSNDNGADDTPGPHDILEDPRLAFLDHHLMPDSPCIDAGIGDLAFDILSSSDIDSQRRVQSCNVDIGADEFPGPFTAVLTVASSLPTGEVEVNLPDCNRDSEGFGQFNRFYTGSKLVTLTVLDTRGFDRWVINGADQPKGEPSVTVDMSDDTFAGAVYSVIQVPKNSPTIQDAINAATEGTVIIVDEGTYVEDIDFLGKSITVRSTDPMDWDVVAGTIIDGSKPATTTVTFNAGEIAGFTIRNGHRGVLAEGDAVVRRCIITQNGDSHGAGINARESSVVANNIITFNGSDQRAGGVEAGLFVTVTNNVIAFNSAQSLGGGIYVGSSTGTVLGNTVVANAAFESGGGIYVRDSAQEHPLIENNIIAFSTFGGGIDADFNAITDYNCVYGNTGGDYVGPQGPGPNDVNKDPLLDVDGIHLLPDSPCIDAGDPDFVPTEDETDIDGDPRVIGDRVDIGADESRRLGDLNGDGVVGAADLLILLASWGECPDLPETCPADLDGDGNVGAADLLILLANWG